LWVNWFLQEKATVTTEAENCHRLVGESHPKKDKWGIINSERETADSHQANTLISRKQATFKYVWIAESKF
jgi:hypothetical protein